MSRIADVIRHANTQHAIYFLLTAYLESLDHLSVTLGLPPWIKRFPIYGVQDVIERQAFFRDAIRRTDRDASWEASIVSEAAHLFGVASNRLIQLGLQKNTVPDGAWAAFSSP